MSTRPQLTAIEKLILNRFHSEFMIFTDHTPYATAEQVARFFQFTPNFIYRQKSSGLLVAHGAPGVATAPKTSDGPGSTAARPRIRFYVDDVGDWALRTGRLRRMVLDRQRSIDRSQDSPRSTTSRCAS